MNQWILVWCYLKAKPLHTILNIFLLALGISVVTVLLLFSQQVSDKVASNTKGIDLVVGAKGSPMQLILCSVFHIDVPTGNIKLSEAERISRHRLVKRSIPMALGDSYQGYRIVGTTRAYAELYHAELQSGAWNEKVLEVTVGSVVAGRLGMKVGDQFASAHGLTIDGHDHETHRYKIAGILKPSRTVLDNLILTNVESIWMVHELYETNNNKLQMPSPLVPSVEAGDSLRELTTLLIQYRNPLAVIQLPRFINSSSNLQAASPSFETARLFAMIGVGAEVLTGFAMVLILISALSIFLALFNSLKERQYDLAIMRSMGAGKKRLFVTILLEGMFLTSVGSFLGLGMGHAAIAAFMIIIPEAQKAGLSASAFIPAEAWMLMGSLVLGFICSFIPAFQAYRIDIHKVLAGN